MFEGFGHYLSYGSTDQKTMLELSKVYEGLVVPGTFAAFQTEGTKGFVLTLAARTGEPYVIDSRFPLFQNRMAKVKKSHELLAEVLGHPDLVKGVTPGELTADLALRLAENWIDFSFGFDSVSSKTFDKYAARLAEDVLPENTAKPEYILAPYPMILSREPEWFSVGETMWLAAQEVAQRRGVRSNLRQVIAADSVDALRRAVLDSSEAQVIIWLNDLDEFRPGSVEKLGDYAAAISSFSRAGKSPFALYGGFFSVLLGRFGLIGSSHGIGFGEHRNWIELPSSGAPPARYYVPRLHKYLSVDLAQRFWAEDPDLVVCQCSDCRGRAPSELDYVELMKHSVRMRRAEIDEWLHKPSDVVIAELRAEVVVFREAVERVNAPRQVLHRLEDAYPHLGMWASALELAEDH